MMGVQERIAADRMWRNEAQRKAFEDETGLVDSSVAGEYHSRFTAWALARIHRKAWDLLNSLQDSGALDDYVRRTPVHVNLISGVQRFLKEPSPFVEPDHVRPPTSDDEPASR